MAFQKLTPVLYTQEIAQTVDFYKSYLGFSCSSIDLEMGWASIQREQIEIMVSLPNDHLPFEKPHFTGSFYFYIDEIDQLWNQLKNKVKIVYPIDSFEYGMREFAIYDNNGYLIQFGQEINT